MPLRLAFKAARDDHKIWCKRQRKRIDSAGRQGVIQAAGPTLRITAIIGLRDADISIAQTAERARLQHRLG